MKTRRDHRYARTSLPEILGILETAARCPYGTLGLFLEKCGVSACKLSNWRAKYGAAGQKLRKQLESERDF